MTGTADSIDPSDQPGHTAPQNLLRVPLIALDSLVLKSSLLLPNGRFSRVDVVKSAGSTNADLAAAAADSQQYWPDLSVLIADAQPAGKGRLGRSWEVPAGAAMISSVLVFPGEKFAPTGFGWLSILAGVALCETVQALTGVNAQLKWPNDVIVGESKLAGILAQVVPAAKPGVRTEAGFGVVIGAGVNVSLHKDELPTERATSLLLEGATTLDRNSLLTAYLNKFADYYQQFVAVGGDSQRALANGASVCELAEQKLRTLGQEVRAELPGGAMLHGTAIGLAADGGLQLRDHAGTVHHVSAGDVIHLRRTTADGAVKYA